MTIVVIMTGPRPSVPSLAALALLLLLTACGGVSVGAADGRLSVVASIYPWQFVAERVGGAHVQVTTLTEPGQEAHDLELSVARTAEVAEADLVVYAEGFQPAVDEAVATAE